MLIICACHYYCEGAWERAGTLRANGGRFEINQLLFADDTALVADSEEKLLSLLLLSLYLRNNKIYIRCIIYSNVYNNIIIIIIIIIIQVRERAGMESELASGVVQRVLR